MHHLMTFFLPSQLTPLRVNKHINTHGDMETIYGSSAYKLLLIFFPTNLYMVASDATEVIAPTNATTISKPFVKS